MPGTVDFRLLLNSFRVWCCDFKINQCLCISVLIDIGQNPAMPRLESINPRHDICNLNKFIHNHCWQWVWYLKCNLFLPVWHVNLPYFDWIIDKSSHQYSMTFHRQKSIIPLVQLLIWSFPQLRVATCKAVCALSMFPAVPEAVVLYSCKTIRIIVVLARHVFDPTRMNCHFSLL